ncbi:MAG: RNA polymerase sigma factor [Bacteroidales bacterium]
MSKSDDILLVSQMVLFGSHKAFEQLVQKYQSPIRRFFLNLTFGNDALSDDLAQETFIKVYMNLQSFKGTAGFSTWLFRVAYNVYYDYIRSSKSNREAGYEEIGMHLESERPNSDCKIDVYESMKVLKPEERTAIMLFYMEDHPVEKISKIMDCPTGTVKSHLSRGREKLAEYFKNTGYEHNFG